MAKPKKVAKKKVPKKPPSSILGTGAARGALDAVEEARRKQKKFLDSI